MASGAEKLGKQIDRVLQLWSERVRAAIAPAEHAPYPILIDTLPAYLTHLVEALSADSPRVHASDGTTIPHEHGGERARLTRYGPNDVIREYQILRDVLFEVIGDMTPAEQSVINRSIDAGVMEASMAYFLVQSTIREQFTALLTHDLRTPLSVARTNASLIVMKSQEPELQKRAQKIIKSVDTADGMIRDLLDASRLRAGEKLPVRLAECDIVAVAAEAVGHLTAMYGEHFELDAPAPVYGLCEASSLRRALENLGANAVKYGTPGTPVTIRIVGHDERITIDVHNHGAPIPVEERETLFQAFRRTAAATRGDRQGWGIGLALVRGFAESHAGSVQIDSLEGKGTTFTIDIARDPRTGAMAVGGAGAVVDS